MNSQVVEVSSLGPLEYTFNIRTWKQLCTLISFSPSVWFDLFRLVSVSGKMKTTEHTFCHARILTEKKQTQDAKCTFFINVRDGLCKYFVSCWANRIHCKNRCKLIQPIATLLHSQSWITLLDVSLLDFKDAFRECALKWHSVVVNVEGIGNKTHIYIFKNKRGWWVHLEICCKTRCALVSRDDTSG